MIGMKNRSQSFNDFYACLQREYLVAELRYKIYTKEKDKNYYLHREMEGKKQTIEAIASRNNFPSIFTDEWLYGRYRAEIYNDWGLPNFIYRSEEDRLNRRPKDVVAYFHKGVSVMVKTDEGKQKGIVVWTDVEASVAVVSLDGNSVQCTFDNLQRIFD